MDKYLRYIYSKSNYFKDCLEDITERDKIRIQNIPSDWERTVSNDRIWIMYAPKNVSLQSQGWKLHISCNYRDIDSVLKAVSDLLFELRVLFKHIYAKPMFDIMHSKNANRISAGKFITIYPNESILQRVVEELYVKLKQYSKASYILTDKRYLDSNIYYRYGGFKGIEISGKLCILDNNGNYIEDLRKPYFSKPDFVTIPEFLEDNNWHSIPRKYNQLHNYSIQKAIKFSASGGIYYAKRKKDGLEVIIKEARSAIGFDFEGNNAIDRLRNEYNILNELIECKNIVKPLELFTVWENEYLVEEFFNGVPLSNWVSANYVFSINDDKFIYLNKVKVIMEEINNVVAYIHSKKIGISDLQPNNIMIDGNLFCKFIDFEAAGDINQEYRGLATFGFSNSSANREINDIEAKYSILKYLLLPISPVDSFDENLKLLHYHYIRNIYGENYLLNELKEYISVQYPKLKCYEFIGLESIKEKLIKGIKMNLLEGDILAYGDVNSYIVKGGTKNYITGGIGIIYSLYLWDEVTDDCHRWIQENINKFYDLPIGLFDGIMGVCNILKMLNYNQESYDLLKFLDDKIKVNTISDISVYSGLAGLLLGYISVINLGKKQDKKMWLQAKKIADRMIEMIDDKLYHENKELLYDFVHGISGSVFSLIVLYKNIGEKKYYEKAIHYLNIVLSNLVIDESSQIMQLKSQDNKLLPYLESGSIGVALNMFYLKNYLKNYEYDFYFDKISNTLNLSIFHDANLFFGAGSQLVMTSMMDEKFEELEKKLKNLLNLYIVRNKDICYVPGRSAMKLSFDILTGSAGLLLGLKSMFDKAPFAWLPIKI